MIKIGGATVTDVTKGIELPPEKRSIGMVFQSYAVWPHMTVFQNVAFPLKVRRVDRKEIGEKVKHVLDLVGLGDFGSRPATDLSGGQQQRVALARALVGQPKLVLFDEPLSNLDAKLREHMRVELISLQERLGFTAIYVTHDQVEALALSDQLIIMNEGVIEQQGTPMAIYKTPMTPFVADFMGASNFLDGRVVNVKGEKDVVVEIEESGTKLICRRQNDRVKQGVSVVVSFRPDNTGLILADSQKSPPKEEEENRVPGRVRTVMFLGEYFEYNVEVGKARIKSRLRSSEPVPAETPVYVTFATEHCVAILADGPDKAQKS